MDEPLYTAYLEGSLKLSKYGEWWHNGRPFQNRKVADLFSRSIVWDEKEQAFFVHIGKGRAKFECEDTAYFILEILDSSAPWQIRVSDGTIQLLDPLTICIGEESQFYCKVHNSPLARFARSAHQALLAHSIDDSSLKIGDLVVKPIKQKVSA